MATIFPDYDRLPPVEGMPKGCAWGVFDKDGRKDVFGCLNKITPEIIKAAASEVQNGVSISLNWPIGAIKHPGLGRKRFVHKVISFAESPLSIHGFDDEVEFNTQCSSQWDSLCHFFHQPSQRAYNGANPSVSDLTQDYGNEDKTKSIPTLNHWHQRGGLVTRGVLIDYYAYAEAHGIKYSPFESHTISIEHIEAIAREQRVTFKQGDIIIIRSGFTKMLSNIDSEKQSELLSINKAVGVEGTEKAAKWFWNNHFSAVAGDTVGFEVFGIGSIADLPLHERFLGLLGIHIGELWDLEALSKHCAEIQRYSFLFTSSPLNVPGSIASPANALAIF